MIIETITMNNFRVFNGQHSFDLNPRVKYNKKRPIILFGGLNGAGKTTTLTAVRLALYGKQSIGPNTSQNQYNEYLSSSIHRPKNRSVRPNASSIELTFTYASMGVVSHYTVNRSWQVNGKKVIEKVSISENGKHLSELNSEQCQGFLNELIPIGVSDLFFFDGEKIAELAEDTKGGSLGDSVKKLLGLDLIETLDADLGILLRSETKKGSSSESQKRIEELESELDSLEKKAESELSLYEQAKPVEIEANNTITKLEAELSSKGGAWADTRESEIKKQAKLTEEKRIIEESIREVLSGSYPLSLATTFVDNTLIQLRNEANHKKSAHTASIVSKQIKILKRSLDKVLTKGDLQKAHKAVADAFSPLLDVDSETVIIHDISDSTLSNIESAIADANSTQKETLSRFNTRLIAINDELDKAGKNIARAPEQAQIKPLMEQISQAHEKRAISISKQKQHIENYKRYLREAIAVARQLEKESSTISTEAESTRVFKYASGAKDLLKEFKSAMAERKVKELESEFVTSFGRLARKEDINLRAAIDPAKFTVKLIGSNDNEIDKDELSAGEKQIYAISILEALARTSGRRLPIIIDTPLGRLDSIHRSKLINNYFPTASHQVIILSTDTEVDEEFYTELSPNISHAYSLDYDPKSGSTSASEGYFWRQ